MAGIPAMQCAGAPAPLAATISNFDQTCDYELLDFLWFYGCVSTLPSGFSNGSEVSPNGATATSHIACDYKLIACGQNGKSCGPACADIIKASHLLHLDQHGASRNAGVEATLLLQQDTIEGCVPATCSISAKANNAAVISMQQCGLPGSATLACASAKWLRQVFDTFDENKDGMLSMEELRRSLEKLGIETSKESIDSLLSQYTSPASKDKKLGFVTHDDFLFLYQGGSCTHDDVEHINCKIMNEDAADEELLRDAFNVFDKDGDGFISPAELQSVLCSLGVGATQAHELDECTDMIKKYDQDGDGQVDFEEFKAMLNLAIKHT